MRASLPEIGITALMAGVKRRKSPLSPACRPKRRSSRHLCAAERLDQMSLKAIWPSVTGMARRLVFWLMMPQSKRSSLLTF